MKIKNVLFIAIALMAITNMSSAAVNISTDGLLAAYDCKEGVDPSILYDVSGNGHDGTLLGTTNWTTEGLLFDGISGYADIGDIGSLETGYTIIAIYNTNDTNYQSILSRTTTSAPSTGGHGFTVRTQHMLQFNDATECVYASYQPLIDPTKYTYTSVRFDGSTIASRSPLTRSSFTCAGFNETSGNYKIGRLSHYAGWYLNGTLAYLAIYDRSMSDSELSETYNILKSEVDDRSINLPPLRDAQIVISHDDGFDTDYTTAYKISSSYGIPTTSYINGARVGQAGMLSWDEIKSLKYAGYDVEGHLYTHVSAITLTEEQLYISYQNNNNAFVSAGLPTPEHMSYPFGAYDSDVMSWTSDYRLSGRGVVSGTSVISSWYGPTSWYNLRAPGIYRPEGGNIDSIKLEIDDAISKNYTLIYHMHDVSLSPSASGCYTPLYEELMGYINSSGIEAVTFDTLYQELHGIRTYPPIEVDTENFIILGETTGSTYDSNVSEVGFVWGTTNLNNPGNLAPNESNYSNSYISDPGNYRQIEFNYTIELTNTTAPYYFYRAGAKVDGAWVYGSEITIANIQPVVATDANLMFESSASIVTDSTAMILVVVVVMIVGIAIGILQGKVSMEILFPTIIGLLIVMACIYAMYGIATQIQNAFGY